MLYAKTERIYICYYKDSDSPVCVGSIELPVITYNNGRYVDLCNYLLTVFYVDNINPDLPRPHVIMNYCQWLNIRNRFVHVGNAYPVLELVK